MKRIVVTVATVVFLFGVTTGFLLTAANNGESGTDRTKDATVKICPHSGRPCDGDGKCQDGECHDGECQDGKHGKGACEDGESRLLDLLSDAAQKSAVHGGNRNESAEK